MFMGGIQLVVAKTHGYLYQTPNDADYAHPFLFMGEAYQLVGRPSGGKIGAVARFLQPPPP